MHTRYGTGERGLAGQMSLVVRMTGPSKGVDEPGRIETGVPEEVYARFQEIT